MENPDGVFFIGVFNIVHPNLDQGYSSPPPFHPFPSLLVNLSRRAHLSLFTLPSPVRSPVRVGEKRVHSSRWCELPLRSVDLMVAPPRIFPVGPVRDFQTALRGSLVGFQSPGGGSGGEDIRAVVYERETVLGVGSESDESDIGDSQHGRRTWSRRDGL